MMHGYNIEIGGAYLLHFRKFIEDDAYHNEAMEVLRKTGWGYSPKLHTKTVVHKPKTYWHRTRSFCVRRKPHR